MPECLSSLSASVQCSLNFALLLNSILLCALLSCRLSLPVPPPSLHRMQYAPICLSINALFAMRMTLGRGGEWTTRSLWDGATWVAADPENTLIPTFLPHSKPAVRFITFLLIFFLEILFFHNHALDTTCMARKILHACVLVVHAAFVFSNPFTFTYRHF